MTAALPPTAARDDARAAAPEPTPDAGATWRRRLLVGVLLAIPVLVFFAPSIFDGKAPGGFDLIYGGSPWRDSEPRPDAPLSPVQVDQAEQLPWVDGAWEVVDDGSFPAWTPHAGGGQAVGTNPIFATWSVFTVAGAPFAPAIGVVIRAVLAVYVAEVFLYWFLRRVALGVGPAVFGAVAYAFCGTPVAFLTRNAIPLLLPVLLVAVDALAERRTPWRALGVAGAFVALWLEGFPAMLVHALGVGLLWWGVRTGLTEGWDLRRHATVRGWVASGAALAGALVLGALLAAASIVPFMVQIRANEVLDARSEIMTPMPMDGIFWLIDDDALGDPQKGPWLTILNPYEGLAAVGTAVMVLALGLVLVVVLAQVWARARPLADLGAGGAGRARRTTFVAASVASAVLVTLIYVGTPVLDLVGKLPGITGNPISRARFVLDLALVVLAALGLDAVIRRVTGDGVPAGTTPSDAEPGPDIDTDPGVARHAGLRRAPGWGVAGAGAAALVAFAVPLVQRGGEYVILLRNHTDVLGPSWGGELALLAAGAAVAAGLLWWGRRHPSEGVLVAVGSVAAAVAFLQVGLPTRDLTPQVDRAYYYPVTEGHATLERLTGGEHRFVGFKMAAFRPNTAMIDGTYDTRSHAFQDPQWRALLNSVWGDTAGIDPLKVNVDPRASTRWGSPVLDDLALQTVVLSSSDIPLGDLTAVPEPHHWRTVLPDQPVELRGPIGPFVGVDTHVEGNAACAHRGEVVLEVLADGLEAPTRSSRPAGDAWGATQTGGTFLFAVPADELDVGTATRVRLSLEQVDPACEVRVGIVGGDVDPALAAGPITRPADADWRMAAAEDGWYYVRDSAPALVRVEGRWRTYPDAAAALAAAVDPQRDPDGPLPVSGAGTEGADGADGTVASWSADARGVTALVDAPGDALVVAAFNSAPGWSASVDGRAVPLVEADGALLAAEVPAGEHQVEFRYRMPGLRAGLALTLLGLVAAVALVVLWPVVSRRLDARRAS